MKSYTDIEQSTKLAEFLPKKVQIIIILGMMTVIMLLIKTALIRIH